MKLKKIFFISGFCIIIFLLISCGENKQKPDFTVSSNITNGKIQTDDTLTIRVNSINKNLYGISFEIKSNNKVREIKPINLNSEINSEYKFLLNNITLGKKELFIKVKNTTEKISFTLLNHIIPTVLDYEILNVFERPNNSYTQGLEFYNDTLYESLGQYGKSKLVKVDFRNGNIIKEYKLKSNFFAEGITVLNNKIYQLTWKEKIGFVYDVNTFDQINSFEYNKSLEGWGICNDGSKLYKSDGTEKIWLLDPDNQKEDGFIEIYTNKNKVVGLTGVDTRSLTNFIRDRGAPKGTLAVSKKGNFNIKKLINKSIKWHGLNGLDLAKEVTTKKNYTWKGLKTWKKGIGFKKSLKTCFRSIIGGFRYIIVYNTCRRKNF